MKGRKNRTMRKKNIRSKKGRNGIKFLNKLKRGTRRLMPNIKHGLENIGEKVRNVTPNTIKIFRK